MSRLVSPCVICETILYSPFPNIPEDEVGNQPDMAVACTTSGNYGSTVLDPVVDNIKLVFNICDNCLLEKRGLFLLAVQKYERPRYEYLPFDPREYEEIGQI